MAEQSEIMRAIQDIKKQLAEQSKQMADMKTDAKQCDEETRKQFATLEKCAKAQEIRRLFAAQKNTMRS